FIKGIYLTTASVINGQETYKHESQDVVLWFMVNDSNPEVPLLHWWISTTANVGNISANPFYESAQAAEISGQYYAYGAPEPAPTVTLIDTPNAPPTCSIAAHSVSNRTLTLTPQAAAVGDATLTDVTVHWDDAATTPACVSGEPVAHSYPPEGGTFGVYVVATDSNGETTTSDILTVVIDPNAAPICSFVVSQQGHTVSVNANNSHDADGAIAAWRLQPKEGAEWIAGTVGEITSVTYPMTDDAALLTVEVTDNEGMTAQQSLSLDLRAPITMQLTTDGAQVTAIITPVSDPQLPSSAVSVQWWPGSPWRSTTNFRASWRYTEPGTYAVTARVLLDGEYYPSDPATVVITDADIKSTPGMSGIGGSTMLPEFLHGVYNQEEATDVIAPVESSTAIPFVVGTAPVHTVAGTPSVNRIEKFSTWADVVATYGDVKDFSRYSLMEFLYAAFRVYGVAPVFCVNVFDPADIAGAATARELDLVGGIGTVPVTGVLVSKVTDNEAGAVTYVAGADYTLTYSVSGEPIITRIADGDIATDTATVYVHTLPIPADYCGVEADDVTAGLQLIDQVYPQYGDVPAHIVSPGHSADPAVGVIMQQKAAVYGGGWKAYALTDIPSGTVTTSAAAYAWKTTNGYTSPYQEVCWPLAKIGNDTYHMSTIMACVLAQVDAQNDNVPYVTGSNYPAGVTDVVLADGTPVYLTDAEANDNLNAKGITTIIRYGARGLVLWGNYTAAYPGSTDALFVWRNYRRMFNWLENTYRLTMMQKVDQPGNLRQIESIVNSEQIYLNGLSAQGCLVGKPLVEFRREDNPTTSLLNGRYRFRTSATPPTAMQAIVCTWVVDVAQLDSLFSAG
ncbi:MAG TPA: hypothetical protein VGL77_03720, partial [Armatimonadota bacterium]